MVSYDKAMRNAGASPRRRKYPSSRDPRFRSNLLFPLFKPKFPIEFSGSKIFTIGSCFARNIEEVLHAQGVALPTMSYTGVPSEYHGSRPSGLLNEYTPATMQQRIMFAMRGIDFEPDTILPVGDLYLDLLLPGLPVTLERAIERRKEVAAIYAQLPLSQLLIVTLGLTETWYDRETKLYLNLMPPPALAARYPGRFEFRTLGVQESFTMLETDFAQLTKVGIKILLSVSPVPLQATFSGEDCIVASEFSKAVLRVTAHRLANNPMIDYFPSYEIVRSGGLSSHTDDLVHVRPDVVKEVTDFMISMYDGSAVP